MIVTLSETAAILSSAQRIVITAHQNPDGDAIGSSLGLMHILRSLGKEASVLLDDDIPAIFSVLPGYDIIGRPDEEKPVEADLLVVLDTATDRTGCAMKAVHAAHPSISIIIRRTTARQNTVISQRRARRRLRSSTTSCRSCP